MSDASVLEIVRSGKKERYEFNGNTAGRVTARRAFEEAMSQGVTLATVVDAPGKSRLVRDFDQVEQLEKERGTVTVRQTAPLVGG